jgi:GTP:adenosylcobinamide-phosphate guanylyltransferase
VNQKQKSFTAVVLAGDRGPDDPVATAAGVSSKSLVPVAGEPMVLRVLDALKGAQEIETVILCGPSWSAVEQEEELLGRIASSEARWVESEATPSSSTYRILRTLAASTPVLVTTADHALLSSEIVDYFCVEARSTACDLVAGAALSDLVAAAYPETRRTVIKLQDGFYCGCNLFAFLTSHSRAAADYWRRVESQRKKTLRVISILGWPAVVRYLLGRLTLAEALQRLSRRMGLRAGVVPLPFPEAAVDVDTVNDWQLVEAIIAKQER